MNPTVASPCTGVCLLGPGTQICIGCLRSVEEITRWPLASDSERRAILLKVGERRAARPAA